MHCATEGWEVGREGATDSVSTSWTSPRPRCSRSRRWSGREAAPAGDSDRSVCRASGIGERVAERDADRERGSSQGFGSVKGLGTSWRIGAFREGEIRGSRRRWECPNSSEFWSSLWQSSGQQQTWKDSFAYFERNLYLKFNWVTRAAVILYWNLLSAIGISWRYVDKKTK